MNTETGDDLTGLRGQRLYWLALDARGGITVQHAPLTPLTAPVKVFLADTATDSAGNTGTATVVGELGVEPLRNRHVLRRSATVSRRSKAS